MLFSSTRVRSVPRALLAALLAAFSLPLTLLAAATPAHAAGLPPASISVSIDPATITADGASTGYVYADIRDTAGQPFTDPDGVVMASTNGDIKFGTSGNNPRLGQTTPAGRWRVKYKASTTAGVETITVNAKNAASVNPPEGVSGQAQLTEKPDAVTSIDLTLTPTHIPADGASKSTAVVTLKDRFNNGVPGQTIVFGVSGDTTPGGVTDNGNGTYTAQITASNTPGPETVVVTGGGKTASKTLTEFGAPTSVVLALNPSTVVADGVQTSAAKVTITDANGNGVANRVVTLTNAPGDSTHTPVANVGDGTYTSTITSSKTASVEQYTAAVQGLALTGSAELTETPGPVFSIGLVLNPTSIVANGTSTSTATVTLADANGNPIKNDQSLTLTKPQGSDVTIGPIVSNNNGTYTATITSSKTSGVEPITATAGGKSHTANLTETPDVPSSVVVSLTPSSVVANGTSPAVAKATVKDANGNLVKDAAVTFSRTGAAANDGGPILETTTKNNGDGTYQVNMVAGTKASVYEIVAKSGATGPSGAANFTQTAGPAATVALTFSNNPIIADGVSTSTAKATVVDAFNNPVSTEVVTITKAVGSNITISPVTDNEDGTYTALVTSSKTAGVEMITAKANNANKTDTKGLTQTPGPVSTVAVVLNPTSVPANGTSTSTATVTVKDANGNNITNEVVEVTAAGGNAVTATNNNNGTYTATVTSNTTPGDRLVTALAKTSNKSGTATLNQYGAVDSITVTATPSVVPADGTTKGTVKATLKDAGGNPVTNAVIGIGTSGDITFGSMVNNNDGTYHWQYTASTTPAVETITVISGKSATTQITEHGAASTVTLALNPATIAADNVSTSTATAIVKDAGGRPVSNEVVTFTSSGDAVPMAVTNKGDGTYTSAIKASTTAGVETITAKATKANKTGQATLTETAGPAASLTVALNPTSIPADGTSTSAAVVTVKDVYGNLVKTETVKLAASGDAVPANSGATTNNGDGTYTGSIKSSTTSGVETITATALGTGAFGSGSLTETAGTPASVTLALTPSTIQANGTSTSTATALVKDANGNVVPNSTVAMATNGDAVVGQVTNNNGTHTATITASTTAGAETITATATGVATPATATLTETAGPVASVVVSLDPASIVADGVSTTKATATVKDANGNLATDDTISFSKDGQVVVANAVNEGNGVYSGTITSSTVAGVKQIVATAASSGQSGGAQLTETAGPLTALTVVLDPTSIVADGATTSNATAVASDANGNAITDEVVTIATSGDAVVGAVANKGDGSYTATITSSKTSGTETITATATKAVKTSTATLTELAGPLTTLTVALNPASIVADGVSTSVATATAKDANNNPVTSAVVTMATNGDTALSGVTNKGDGTYTSTITSSTTSGIETITASVASPAKTATAALTETAGAATSVVVSLSPSSIVADGAATSVATATIKDVNNNLVKDELVTFTTSGDAKFGPVSNKGDGTYTSTITASKTVGTETIAAKATKANKTGVATLTETARPLGYWLTAEDGGLFNYGSAGFYGSIGGKPLNKPVVGMQATPDRKGYWQVATDGGIFNYGSAPFKGSMGGQPLNAPVVGMASNTTGDGYWLVASDGGIFAFNAPFYGSRGGQPLNKPIVGMAADPDGDGYWFVASDGGIFAYNAPFFGSLGSTPLNSPIVGMSPTPDGKGYWMVAADGGVFGFGTAGFHGSMGGKGINDVVGLAGTSTGKGYWLTGKDGSVYAFGDAALLGSPKASGLKLVSPLAAIAGY